MLAKSKQERIDRERAEQAEQEKEKEDREIEIQLRKLGEQVRQEKALKDAKAA